MAKKELDKVATTSEPILNDNLQKLRGVFPQFVKDGQIDFDALKAFFDKEGIAAGPEKYGLSWAGKSNAVRALQTSATGTLTPQEKESKNWDTTQNIFIQGDNLEVLKLLQKQYANPGKIKMIYIDPPYNTGKDFVYKDNFTEGVSDYYERTGQSKDGIKLTANLESNGRYHSDWLTMMYPRLFLAKNLLKDDGVIFVSIDGNEVTNLRLIMDEIFGEENFIEIFSWVKTETPSNLSETTKKEVEYILCYQRGLEKVTFIGVKKTAVATNPLLNQTNRVSILTFPANSIQSNIADGRISAGMYGTKAYEIELLEDAEVAQDTFVTPLKLKAKFRWSQTFLEDEIKKGTKILVPTKRLVPSYDRGDYGGETPSNLIDYRVGVETNEQASSALRELMGKELFSYPKPVSLLYYITSLATSGNDTVLDFFAGSGTLSEAVYQLNTERTQNINWISVQLPEELKIGNGKTQEEKQIIENAIEFLSAINKKSNIAEICKERIRRAGDKIGKGDIGFKAFALEQSNYRRWSVITDADDAKKLLEMERLFIEKPLVDKYDEKAVVYEVLLKEGFSLNAKVKKTKPHKGTKDLLIWRVTQGEHKMVISFAKELTRESVDSLELSKDDTFVCLDSALDDSAKVNISKHVNLKVI